MQVEQHVQLSASYVSLLCEGCIGFVPLTAGQKPSWVSIFLLVVSPHNQSRNMFSSAWGWISLLVSLAEKVSRVLPVLIFVSFWMDLTVVRFPHKINTGHSNDKPLINHSFKSTWKSYYEAEIFKSFQTGKESKTCRERQEVSRQGRGENC